MKRPIIDSAEDRITDAAVVGSSTKLVKAGAVLCVMRSGILRHTFPVAVNVVDATLNQDMRALTPNPGIDPFFVAHFLRSTGEVILDRCGKDGTTVNSIEAERLDHHLVPVPPLETQREIVARIDALFAEVEDGEAALAPARADLGTWRKALLKAAVTGDLTADWRAERMKAEGPPPETGSDLLARILTERRTRWNAEPHNNGRKYVEPAGPDTDELPELPEGWVWATLAQLGEVSGGVTKNAKRDIHQLRLPYLRVGNVYAGRLDLDRVETIGLAESEVARISLREGDLLIVEGNGSLEQIGRSAVWTGEIDPCVHQNHLIKVRPAIRILADYIQAWLRSPGGRKTLEQHASSTSGLHTLSISKVEAVRCPLPPLHEIAQALFELDVAMAKCSDAEADEDMIFDLSATLRQSILAAAFRGALNA